jgi:hypothetical protein
VFDQRLTVVEPAINCTLSIGRRVRERAQESTGQTLVKHWSNNGQKVVNCRQIKTWSNTGQLHINKWLNTDQGEHWSSTGQTLVKSPRLSPASRMHIRTHFGYLSCRARCVGYRTAKHWSKQNGSNAGTSPSSRLGHYSRRSRYIRYRTGPDFGGRTAFAAQRSSKR